MRFVTDGKFTTEAQTLLVTHLQELLRQMGVINPQIEVEYRFTDERDWRFDVAIPSMKLAFEVDGGKWTGGHRRGKAIDDENEKKNVAILDRWRVLTFTNDFVLDGRAKEFLDKWLR